MVVVPVLPVVVVVVGVVAVSVEDVVLVAVPAVDPVDDAGGIDIPGSPTLEMQLSMLEERQTEVSTAY